MEEDKHSLWPYAVGYLLYRRYKNKKRIQQVDQYDDFYYYEEE